MKLSLQIFKKKTAPIVWMLLGLFVIYPMAQHSWSGIVLCIGSDGHVELEDGRASDCATEVGKAVSETHYEDELALAEPEVYDDCGPCVDLALLASPFDGQRASNVSASVSPDVTPQITILQFAGENTRALDVNLSSPVTKSLPFFAPLRTVALLI